MVNEEKIKQLYKVAACEKRDEKLHRQTVKYYRSDFISKEILKSIFTGTMAYGFMSALLLVNKWEHVVGLIDHKGIGTILIPVLYLYILFMLTYVGFTYVVYKSRYEISRAYVEEYEKELQALESLYESEEKLKQ